MHIQLITGLVVVAVVAAVLLLLNRGDRLFPVIAVVAAGIAVLIAFGIIELSVGRFRIDVILAGVMAVAGGVCWMRSNEKTTISAATALTLSATAMLLMALGFLK
jgi:hypothetical protein